MWVNNLNKKCYVGSSINLAIRLKSYYRINKSSILRTNMPICRSVAIKKYGFSNFSLKILEFCDKHSVLGREQHYMDLLKPKYNVNPKAGSRLGAKDSPVTLVKKRAFRHSEATLAKLRGRRHSQETLVLFKNLWAKKKALGWKPSEAVRLKISESMRGKKHSIATIAKIKANWVERKKREEVGWKLSESTREKMRLAKLGRKLTEEQRAKLVGRKHSEITRKKMSTSNLNRKWSDEHREKMGQSVDVLNIETGEQFVLPSMSDAAKLLGVTRYKVKKAIESGEFLISSSSGQKITYKLTSNQDKSLKKSAKKSNLGKSITVFVENRQDGEIVEYTSISKAAEALGYSWLTI